MTELILMSFSHTSQLQNADRNNKKTKALLSKGETRKENNISLVLAQNKLEIIKEKNLSVFFYLCKGTIACIDSTAHG